MVRAKSTRPALLKKAVVGNLSAGPHSGRRKETAKRDAVMASVCHGDYCFLFLAAFFISLSVLLPLEALLWF